MSEIKKGPRTVVRKERCRALRYGLTPFALFIPNGALAGVFMLVEERAENPNESFEEVKNLFHNEWF